MKWLIYTLHYSHIQMIRSPLFKLLYYTVESKILYLNISSTVSKDLEYYMSPVFCFPDQAYLLNGLHACYVSSVVSNTYNPMDCRLPGSSVHGILQAIILEWVAISSSCRSSWTRDWTLILKSPALAGRFFTTSIVNLHNCQGHYV